jgi:malonyl-CoA/methylmalonyl-CoA synthetase
MLRRPVLLPSLLDPGDAEALRADGRSLTARQLRRAADGVAAALAGHERVALWATPSLGTCVGVVGGVLAGATVVPLNPKVGERDLAHVLADAAPTAVIAERTADLPAPLSGLSVVEPLLEAGGVGLPDRELWPEHSDEDPAFIVYTSGTTGPPKGVLIPRRAVASNLDALAAVWRWGPEDVLTHGLPLFHVHGLILGVLGPLRAGGSLRYAGRFSPEAIVAELEGGATMVFGVPTMYHLLADAAEQDPRAAKALAGARVLVSGSAPLAEQDFRRIEAATGQRLVDRYGLTETIMNTAVPVDGARRPGTVGPPLPGVEVRVLDEAGSQVPLGGEAIGDVVVQGPNLFLGYLNRPDATAAAMDGGWFRTGDLASVDADDYVRIVGRRATDLIKTGGYKVGAGEVEAALLEHPAVLEAAVTGEPDDRLGERIVAWVVLRPGASADERALQDQVADLLAPHKRPREVRFLDALPRNEMGKVRKAALRPSQR